MVSQWYHVGIILVSYSLIRICILPVNVANSFQSIFLTYCSLYVANLFMSRKALDKTESLTYFL